MVMQLLIAKLLMASMLR